MDERYDVIIIGGGPAGLSAAINCAVRGASALVIDSGGTKLALAERVDNYLGMPGIGGKDMMSAFTSHALGLGVAIMKGKATSVLPMGKHFMISAGDKVITAAAVVLAIGAVIEKPIPGEEEYLGKGVSYCATCDGMLYRGQKAVVFGISSDSPEEANYLSGIGVEVTYICPGQKPDSLRPDIEWRSGIISSIKGAETVTQVELKDLADTHIDTRAVFILRDAIAAASVIPGLRAENGFVVTAKDTRTNIPGVFACGDCAGPPPQIAKAVGDGLVAGQEAARYAAALRG